MSDVDRVLQEFIAADRAGIADPSAYLARVSGVDRLELEALIDGYLARAPRRPFDRAAFEASPAAQVVAAFDGWPALLPRLRERARLARAELVTRLAAELGVGGREAKVGTYYDRMEQGTLPALGVSDSVFEALGRILGESAAVLRAAGTAGPPPALAAGAAAPAAAPAPAAARRRAADVAPPDAGRRAGAMPRPNDSTPPDASRRAGAMPRPDESAPPAGAPRRREGAPAPATPPPSADLAAGPFAEPQRDEVDLLFTGGA
jgi:hypothetical protein